MTFVKKRTIKKCEEIIEIELQRRKTQLNEDNRKQLLTKIIEIVSSAQNEYSDCKIYNLVGYLLDSNYPAASDIERCSEVVKEELQKNNIAFDNNQLIELTKEIMRISWSKGSDYSSKMIRAYTQAYLGQGTVPRPTKKVMGQTNYCNGTGDGSLSHEESCK